MKLTIDLEQEEDGRWIAEVSDIPGVMSYGQGRDEAISNVERLAIEEIADRIAHGELPSSALAVAFNDGDEIGPRMMARIAKSTGLKPEEL